MDDKCSRCKRDAKRGFQHMPVGDTVWYCTFHWNRLIRDRRIDRGIKKSADRRTPEKAE